MGNISPTLQTEEPPYQIKVDGKTYTPLNKDGEACKSAEEAYEHFKQYTESKKYRIRKLTPKECWRLMGFKDEDYEKAKSVNSNTQLYKQAGNSIVVPVLEAIFRNMRIQEIPTWEEVNDVEKNDQ